VTRGDRRRLGRQNGLRARAGERPTDRAACVPHNACGESPHLDRVGFPSAWRRDRQTKKVRCRRDLAPRPFAFSANCIMAESPSRRREKELRGDAVWGGQGSAHLRLSLRTPLFGNCYASQPGGPRLVTKSRIFSLPFLCYKSHGCLDFGRRLRQQAPVTSTLLELNYTCA
jgi:hypothetical protein